jgi:hypothetical protein
VAGEDGRDEMRMGHGLPPVLARRHSVTKTSGEFGMCLSIFSTPC